MASTTRFWSRVGGLNTHAFTGRVAWLCLVYGTPVSLGMAAWETIVERITHRRMQRTAVVCALPRYYFDSVDRRGCKSTGVAHCLDQACFEHHKGSSAAWHRGE